MNVKPLERNYFKEAYFFKLYSIFSYSFLNNAMFHDKPFSMKNMSHQCWLYLRIFFIFNPRGLASPWLYFSKFALFLPR